MKAFHGLALGHFGWTFNEHSVQEAAEPSSPRPVRPARAPYESQESSQVERGS